MDTTTLTKLHDPSKVRVFVSHVHEDNDLCRPLLTALDAWGVDRWFDSDMLRVGDVIPSVVISAINNRDVFIRICTSTMQRRPRWVDQESELFLQFKLNEERAGLTGKRQMLNIIMDADFKLDQYCRQYKYLDTIGKDQRTWLQELRESLGIIVGVSVVEPVTDFPPFRSTMITKEIGLDQETREMIAAGEKAQAMREIVTQVLGDRSLHYLSSRLFIDTLPPSPEGQAFELPVGEFHIVRMDEDVLSLHDGGVSRLHAKLVRDKSNQSTIFDLESTNGTFVNEEPVGEGGRLLNDGDKIRVGRTILQFKAN